MTTDDPRSGRDGSTDGRPGAREQPTPGHSRRGVLKRGMFGSTAALVGIPGGSATAGAASRAAAGDEDEGDPLARVAMFPHQFSPGARFRIERFDLEWRPGTVERLEGTYRTHAIAYDFSRSFGAFAFVDGDRSLEPDRRYLLGSSPAAALGAGRSLVSIDVEPAGEEMNGET